MLEDTEIAIIWHIVFKYYRKRYYTREYQLKKVLSWEKKSEEAIEARFTYMIWSTAQHHHSMVIKFYIMFLKYNTVNEVTRIIVSSILWAHGNKTFLAHSS